MRYYFFILIFIVGVKPLCAQTTLDDIDLMRIPQQKIRDFIDRQKDNNIRFLSEVKGSVLKDDDIEGLRKHKKTYLFKADSEHVWATYLGANPDKSWSGRRVSFGLLISRIHEQIMYINEPYLGLDTGQVFYINVGVLRGMENLAVAFEVTDIDQQNKRIEFSYVNGGKSIGKQVINFKEHKNGQTRVEHRTHFKSDSKLRDRFLYPYFHTKVIKEYHQNMRKLISQSYASNPPQSDDRLGSLTTPLHTLVGNVCLDHPRP